MKWYLTFGTLAALVLVGASQPPEQPRTGASSPECREHRTLPRPCNVIVFDGDSISAGGRATPGNGLDIQFMLALGSPARLYNIAVAGRPVIDCLTRFDQGIVPLKDPQARLNLIVFHAGANDIAKRHSAAQTYQAFTNYVALAHTQGWKVVMSAELPRPDFLPAQEAELEAYNRYLLENKAGADVVVNVNADRRFGDLKDRDGSPVFSFDKIHPNDAGYAIFGQLLAAAVRPLLTQ
jgi:lysophospholipase L1-like esterase